MVFQRHWPAIFRFIVREPPIAVDGFPLHLAWHIRRDRNPAVRHVAGSIEKVLAG